MNIIVILLTLALSGVEAGLFNPELFPKSWYGGFSYTSPYEAISNYHRDRYYAKKAHDIARLQSLIHGVGNGFYGYRHGSFSPKFVKPLFPGHGGPIKPNFGQWYQKPLFPPPPSTIAIGELSGGYYPPQDFGTFTQKFAGGKGYSNSVKSYSPGGLSFPPYTKVFAPPSFFQTHIPAPGSNIYPPDGFFTKSPPFPKISPNIPYNGYNSIYGTRYGKLPIPGSIIGNTIPVPPWNVHTVAVPPGDDSPSFPLVPGPNPYNPDGFFVKGSPVSKITPNILSNGYNSIYGTRYGKMPIPGPKIGNPIPVVPWNVYTVAGPTGNASPKEYGIPHGVFQTKQPSPPIKGFPISGPGLSTGPADFGSVHSSFPSKQPIPTIKEFPLYGISSPISFGYPFVHNSAPPTSFGFSEAPNSLPEKGIAFPLQPPGLYPDPFPGHWSRSDLSSMDYKNIQNAVRGTVIETEGDRHDDLSAHGSNKSEIEEENLNKKTEEAEVSNGDST